MILVNKHSLSSNADDGRTKPVPRKGHVESFEPADNKCLLRATDGKKKISTVVSDSFGLERLVALLVSYLMPHILSEICLYMNFMRATLFIPEKSYGS